MPDELDITQQKRVRQISTGQTGLVVEEAGDATLVHWGTISMPSNVDGKVMQQEQKITSWVPSVDLEPFPDSVWYGDGDKKAKVYDPDA